MASFAHLGEFMTSDKDRFHRIAAFTHELARSIPGEFREAVYQAAGLTPGQTLLELGCGSGELAAWFAERGVVCDAVDVSPTMIALARSQSDRQGLRFHCEDAVGFMRGAGRTWNAAVALGSLHIFLERSGLPDALHRALGVGGRLVVAWRSMEWVDVCRQKIVEVFAEYGVAFDDWGYWSCPGLLGILGDAEGKWREEPMVHVSVPHSSSVDDVVQFVTAIDRVQDLGPSECERLKLDLESEVSSLSTDGRFHGLATYSARALLLSES